MNRTTIVLAAAALAAAMATPLAAADYDRYEGAETDAVGVGYIVEPDPAGDTTCTGTFVSYVMYGGGEDGATVEGPNGGSNKVTGDRYYLCMEASGDGGLWKETNPQDDLQTEEQTDAVAGVTIPADTQCVTAPVGNVNVNQYLSNADGAAISCAPSPTVNGMGAPMP